MRKTFREYLQDDLDKTFFCKEEYAEVHEINGKEYPCQLQKLNIEDKITVKNSQHMDGVFTDSLFLFIDKKYIQKPVENELIEIDDDAFIVQSVQDQLGLLIVELLRNES